MDLQGLKLFQAMGQQMDWLSQRQRVLSQNVANADTPDYVANDLKPLSFSSMLRHSPQHDKSMRLEETVAGHIAGSKPKGTFRRHEDRAAYEITPTGNSVTLEEQMLKVSETSESYKLTTQLYKKYTSMMKLVVRGGA
jgi:flagellar basal-body rod protein FlgB